MPDPVSNLNSALVSTGKPYASGAIFAGPVWTAGMTLPTSIDDVTSAAGYSCVGYISDAGVANEVTTETSETKAWGGDRVLESLDSYAETYGFTCIELNETALKLAWGSVTGTVAAGLTVDHSSAGFDTAERVIVIACALKDGRVLLIVIPKAKLQSIGSITYNDSDPIGHELTFSALASGFADNAKATSRHHFSAVPSGSNG